MITEPGQVSAAASGPVILAKSPSTGAGNVTPNSPLLLTFDENVSKGTGSAAITIRKSDNDEVFESYIVSSDSRVAINASSRNLVTITPSKPFVVNERYYVIIDAGAFKNESNNVNFNGLTSPADWNFKTVETLDTTAPTAVGLEPANGGTAIIGAPLSIQFDEPVYAAGGTITVTNVNQPSDFQTISAISSNVTGNSTAKVTFALNNALKPSSTYEVQVSNGAFQDLTGNKFSGVSAGQWRFATAAPPLGAAVLQPADNSSSVSVASNFVITFPVNVAVNTGNIRINAISDNSTVQTISVASSNVTVNGGVVTINPPADLAGKKGYYILIDPGAFKDASNGALLFEGITAANDWNFETDYGDDTTAPTLASERKPGNIQTTPAVDIEMNFSEPVYPGSGNIVIKTSNGAVVASIPVTSSKVTGGGTTKIAVKDSSVVLVNNSRYYIQIDGQAFQDARGNKFAGITGSTDWQFTVSQDTDKPSLIALTPTNNAKDVAISSITLEALFSEQIQLGTTPIVPSVTIKRAAGTDNTPVTTKLSIDPQNSRKLLIKPDTALASFTDYYVEMAEGTVTDLAGNKFDGILNRAQWTFKTVNSANGAPVISKAEVLGNSKIVLTFNEGLDANSVPVPANFYVTVNGAGRSVTAVQVSGQAVTLTLQGTISTGQVVKVSYSAGTKPIQDSTGTPAANFLDRDITNNPDNTPPRQLNGTVNGNTIILNFNEDLEQVSSNANSQFSVYVGGSYRSINQVSSSGKVMFITFNGNAAASNETVSLSYYAASYPVKDLAGNNLASFSSFQIQNGVDNKPPALQSMTTSANQITLVYDESLNSAFVPPTSAFTVTVNGTARGVSSVNVSGTYVILNVSQTISSSDYVVVSYAVRTPALSDFGGNSAPAFTNMTVNGSNSSSISYTGAIAKAGVITVTFTEALNSAYVPSSSQFSVKVNNVTRPISSISINGTSLTINLYTPVAIGDTVKMSYSTSGITLRGTGGVLVSAFTDINVANQTSWTDNVGGDFEAAAGGGLSIKKTGATTVSGISPAGRSANQYELTAEKITLAYSAVRSASGMQPRVVFTVPDNENAGIVAVSLKALEDAKNAAPSASFAVVYKDATYEIPLSALDYRQLGQLMNAAGPVGQLVFYIDTNAIGMSSQLTAALNGSGAQLQVSPVSFELAVKNGGQSKSIDSLNGYVSRSITTGSTLDPRQTAVVWLDPQTGKVSYVPTTVTQENGKSVVTFKRKGNSVYAIVKGGVKYTDIAAKHWARNDILLMGNKYIVEGRTLTTFEPDKPITRGEFAMFIAKGLGLSGDKQAAGKFKDVNTSTSMAAYIGAASNAGIVQGMTDGTFKPNSLVTREQMASMMVRAANAAGKQITLSQTQSEVLKRFADNKKIGTWAQGDVAKAVEARIINGMSANTFGGKTNATRAQAAVMTKRLLEYVDFIDV
ncbi:Ig-like domain-containing protein [Paenibacillus oenotherae]|uniref:Ig-like domain-containing protein n=1 Tax=Paenibacillus oenotherae TaxID=1435645 RepID=A0ABS7D4Z1_9BACL|nr:Ig-like domain-containing protein [Paenibacillus oenotherae]MBW7475007.1 Ig-like domain-containing protein [Paenibacillus oenotherae]